MQNPSDPSGHRLAHASEEERRELKAAIDALARPRLSGTPGAAECENELRDRFQALGYEVRELPFRFSSWPGRFGLPFVGALYLLGVLSASFLIFAGNGLYALGALLALLIVVAAFAGLSRHAIARLPFGRVETANWLVHRPGATPEHIMVAHRDSKSQLLSLWLRIGAIAFAPLAWVGLLVLAILELVAPSLVWTPLLLALAAGGTLAGAGLALARADNRSPGALDNASGVAALLGIARRERDHGDVAFLVTDGEELGLAGAWAAAAQIPRVSSVINLDGLDDEGGFYLIERYPRGRVGGLAPTVAAALLTAAQRLDYAAERRRLPVGLLADHIPFARAGFQALTILRGTHRSLQRAHRPHDDKHHLRGEGVAATVALVSGALSMLRSAGEEGVRAHRDTDTPGRGSPARRSQRSDQQEIPAGDAAD